MVIGPGGVLAQENHETGNAEGAVIKQWVKDVKDLRAAALQQSRLAGYQLEHDDGTVETVSPKTILEPLRSRARSGERMLAQPTALLFEAWGHGQCAIIGCGAAGSRSCVADTCGIAPRMQRRFESGSAGGPEWLRCRAARLGSALQWWPRCSSAGAFRRKSGSCKRDVGEWFHPDRDLRFFGEAFGRAPLGDTPLCTKP